MWVSLISDFILEFTVEFTELEYHIGIERNDHYVKPDQPYEPVTGDCEHDHEDRDEHEE